VRTPVASATALAIAGATGLIAHSPWDLAPSGPIVSTVPAKNTSVCGMSAKAGSIEIRASRWKGASNRSRHLPILNLLPFFHTSRIRRRCPVRRAHSSCMKVLPSPVSAKIAQPLTNLRTVYTA
jgi:hypothetical protein